MVDDAFGGRFQDVNYNEATNEPVDETPNLDANDFFKMLKESEEPISDGSTTVLKWVSKFMAIKNLHNISDIACDKMIQLVKSAMKPEDRAKIPDSVYGMKRLLKKLGLGYVTYDVCVNHCVLYYGDLKSMSTCPQCGEDRYEEQRNTNRRAKPISRKKLWYFPLIPRLQRLYMSRKTAEHMTWHVKYNGNNDSMIHPAAGEAWKSFDDAYPSYTSEPRNIRLGLSTNGFTPWGNSGVPYSCWPVFVTPYNLSLDMCMRQEYIYLTLLISGPKSPGKNINVMLRSLIDDLKTLWDSGDDTYDSFRQQHFLMKAHVMWTISDFPGYAMLSQWSTHGRLSCPYCMEGTKSFWLKNGRKHTFFDCHRRFLPLDHPWRANTRDFIKNKAEWDPPLVRRSGEEMQSIVDDLPVVRFRKNEGQCVLNVGKSHNWCRRSIFWELPYWKSNLIRHNLDVMHCEKNFFDNIKNTVMDVPDKTKDNLKSRMDLQELTHRSYLNPRVGPNGQIFKKKAKYCLTKEQKYQVCNWLSGIKFADGYASNISRCIQMPQERITGMKSHDCHVFMQRLIPIAFRDILPDFIWEALVEVSLFFKSLCAAELSRSAMEQLESSIVVTMCKLEQIFPLSFFDSMEHLAIHLLWEAKVGGPVQYRWMYPFERRMRELKGAVHNRARVEGSICEAYLFSEATYFASLYFEPDFETRANRLNRNEVHMNAQYSEEFSIFHKKGKAIGGAFQQRQLNDVEYIAAELYVLLNCPEAEPWIRLFNREECQGLSEQQTIHRRSTNLVAWLKATCNSGSYHVDPRMTKMLQRIAPAVRTFNGYIINGCRFHTYEYDRTKKTNNSGVYVKACSDIYYGVLQEIIEIYYWGGDRRLSVVLFKCNWVDPTRGTVVHPNYGLVDIHLKRLLASGDSDPFILASQALQACYFQYPSTKRKGWLSVCPIKSRFIVDTTSLSFENHDNVEQGTDNFQENTVPEFNIVVDFSSFNLINLTDEEFVTAVDVNEAENEDGEEDEDEEEYDDDSSDPDY